jgi:hypothetical protein
MSQSIRQEIVTLVGELPDELLPEVLTLLHSLVKEDSSSFNSAEFDQTIAAYQVISKKYKNALRKLAQ